MHYANNAHFKFEIHEQTMIITAENSSTIDAAKSENN